MHYPSPLSSSSSVSRHLFLKTKETIITAKTRGRDTQNLVPCWEENDFCDTVVHCLKGPRLLGADTMNHLLPRYRCELRRELYAWTSIQWNHRRAKQQRHGEYTQHFHTCIYGQLRLRRVPSVRTCAFCDQKRHSGVELATRVYFQQECVMGEVTATSIWQESEINNRT